MLYIDRVQTEMDLVPDARPAAGGPDVGAAGTPLNDPALDARLRATVLAVLRDHMRELERRGMV